MRFSHIITCTVTSEELVSGLTMLSDAVSRYFWARRLTRIFFSQALVAATVGKMSCLPLPVYDANRTAVDEMVTLSPSNKIEGSPKILEVKMSPVNDPI